MRTRAALAALALVVLAVVVHRTEPTSEETTAPFVVDARTGEWTQGRTFAVRVDAVGLADELTDGDWTGTTEGVWVVVTLGAETAVQPGSVTGELRLGELRFDASSRPGLSALNGETLPPGLASVGDLVFEVPVDALADHGGDARLRLSARLDPRLDSAVELPVGLDDLEPVALRELTPVERTTR